MSLYNKHARREGIQMMNTFKCLQCGRRVELNFKPINVICGSCDCKMKEMVE